MCVSNDVFPLKAIYSSCGVILHERGNSKFKMADTRIVLNKIYFKPTSDHLILHNERFVI